ncbi:hypothetical protein V8F33_002981 [Rhypophila sp. PSN 637]
MNSRTSPNPLAGAAKHLHSTQHGNFSKERAQAVELLGNNIFDCDENKMKQNNQMVSDAFQNGYKPFNLNQLTMAERKNLNLPGDASPITTPPKATPTPNPAHRGSTREASQKLFVGITHPVPGDARHSGEAVLGTDLLAWIEARNDPERAHA